MTSKPRYRLMIEGAPTEWVTDSSLEAALSDGRVRRQGLMYEGLKVEEEIDLREGTTRVSGTTIRICSDYADAEFAFHPEHLGFLASDIDYDDTSLTLESNTGGISVDDVIHLGTEALKVTSVVTVTIGVTRQYWDTQAQGHYAQIEDRTEYVPIYNRVPSYEGRRVFLFRYDEGDTSDEANLFDFAANYQGANTDTTDTVIYRGIISRPPELDSDGITWTLDVEPITFLLEQEIATAEFEFTVKGVYHHAMCGLAIICTDYDDGFDSKTTSTVRGFHPTEKDFIKAVNDALSTLRTTAFTHTPQTLSFDWSDDVGYRVDMTTHATETSGISVTILSPLIGVLGIDGDLYKWKKADGSAVYHDHTAVGGATLPANTRFFRSVDHGCTVAVFGGYTHIQGIAAAANTTVSGGSPNIKNVIENDAVDRCILGAPAAYLKREYKDAIQDSSVNTTYPLYRLHIDRDPGAALTTGSYVLITGEYADGPIQATCRVLEKGQDATHNTTYISVISNDPDFDNAFPVTARSTITLVSSYGTKQSVGGFIDAVIDLAVEANKGTTPFITYADFDAISYIVLNQSLPRDWSFQFTNAVTLEEIIREHLKLYGWYMHLNSVGEIAFSSYEAITDTDGTTVATIDDEYIITPPNGYFPKWKPAIDGVVNVVEISRNYDWMEDSFDDNGLLTVRDVLSLSTHKNRSRGVTEIQPKGTYLGTGGSISYENGYERAKAYLALHSTDYDVVEFNVTSNLFDVVQCSSLVKVTSPHVMNSATGVRGVTNKVGLVIGKSYSLDPGKGASGKVTVRLNRDAASGYAPAMRATAYTVYSGYTYTVTVSSTYFAPASVYDTSFFSVGDKIRVNEFKSAASPNSEAGTIAAINSTTSVRVTLSASFPSSASGLWDIEYDDDDGALNDGQNNYCFVADSNALLYSNVIGRRFA